MLQCIHVLVNVSVEDMGVGPGKAELQFVIPAGTRWPPAARERNAGREKDDKRQAMEQVDCSIEIKGYKNKLCAFSYLTSDCYCELFCDCALAYKKDLV